MFHFFFFNLCLLALVCCEVKDLTVRGEVKKAIGPALSGLQYESESFFADLVTDACS